MEHEERNQLGSVNRFFSRVNRRLAKCYIWATLGYLEKLGVIFAVALFLKNVGINNERKHDERIQKHLHAWQTINLGRTGDWSGMADGRIEAIESLLKDKVNLDGVALTMAWLVGADLRKASFRGASFYRSTLDLADMRYADLAGASFDSASFDGLNIYGAHGLSTEQETKFLAQGAVQIEHDRDWTRYRDKRLADLSFWQRNRQ